MRDPPGPPSIGEDSIVEGCPTGLCQICDRLRGIPDHSGSLQRMGPSQGSLATANSYAHLHGLWSRTENPVLVSTPSHVPLGRSEAAAGNCLAISTPLKSSLLTGSYGGGSTAGSDGSLKITQTEG